MEEIISKNKCTGCGACANICPKHAISMIENNEGFKYPVIDESKCVNCGLCKKTCPAINTKTNYSINECYVGYSKEKIDGTSSGSIFPLLANYILDNNGIVIGASFNKNNKLEHIAITNKKELNKLKGSKYLQSDLNNIFEFVKENIKNKKVLFVGTPCQVAGLKSFLKKDYENLYCVDLVCHGVPSPKLFNKYVNELENKYNDKLINYNFRDKRTGWDSYSNTATFYKREVSELQSDNDYMKLFLSNVALRESCYNCNFKLGNKYSDITLGDFWGVKNYYPEMYNKNGVSAIILNTPKGQDLFNEIKNELEYKDCELEKIVAGNPCLKKSCNKPQGRNIFFDDIDNESIKDLRKKYFKTSIISRIKGIIKKILKKIINR